MRQQGGEVLPPPPLCEVTQVILHGVVSPEWEAAGAEEGWGGTLPTRRCRASMAHIQQARPDYGLGFQEKVPKTFQSVPFSLGSGRSRAGRLQPGAWTRVSLSLRLKGLLGPVTRVTKKKK